MAAILAISLLHLAAYVEAVVIVLLLGFIGFVWHEAMRLMRDYERAETERDEARRTLHTFRRMNEIHAYTVTRLREFGR